MQRHLDNQAPKISNIKDKEEEVVEEAEVAEAEEVAEEDMKVDMAVEEATKEAMVAEEVKEATVAKEAVADMVEKEATKKGIMIIIMVIGMILTSKDKVRGEEEATKETGQNPMKTLKSTKMMKGSVYKEVITEEEVEEALEKEETEVAITRRRNEPFLLPMNNNRVERKLVSLSQTLQAL